MMGHVVVRLRPAVYEDASLLFEWANDEAVRKCRLSGSDPVEWLSHCEWLRRRVDGLVSERVFMAIYGDDCAVGVGKIYVNFLHVEHNDALIGVTVSPEARRSGVGYQIIKLLVDEIKKECRTPVARVLRDNIPSQRLFAGSGFKFTGGSTGWLEYRIEA
jgi:RimJ/RimL family protein N-acetyltransferase